MAKKEVYSIKELIEVGHSEETLRQLLKCDEFPEFGYRLKGKNSKAYFYRDKMEAYLQKMTEVYR